MMQESLVLGPGVLPVDGLSINIDEMKRQALAAASNLNQPYNSITSLPQNMIPASTQAPTNTAANGAGGGAAGAVNPKKQALDNLIKLGIVINTIDVSPINNIDHLFAHRLPWLPLILTFPLPSFLLYADLP